MYETDLENLNRLIAETEAKLRKANNNLHQYELSKKLKTLNDMRLDLMIQIEFFKNHEKGE